MNLGPGYMPKAQGPHCPKCGQHSNWEPYGGPPTGETDALRCMTAVPSAGGLIECGYIHWRRNAPAVGSPDNPLPDTGDPFQPMRDLIARRARVRALVLAMMGSGLLYDKFDTEWLVMYDRFTRDPSLQGLNEEMTRLRKKSIVTVACELDEQIEAVTNIQGRDL